MSPAHDILLVPAGPEDAGKLEPVYQQCEQFLRLASSRAIDTAMVRQDIESSQRAGGLYCAVLVDGKVAGVTDFLSAGFDADPAVGFITLLMLGEKWRGNGAGRAALALIEAEITADPLVSQIQLAVQTNNTAGAGFWEHMGYQVFTQPAAQADGSVTCLYRKFIAAGQAD